MVNRTRWIVQLSVVAIVCLSGLEAVVAVNPLSKLIVFRRIEAQRHNAYPISEESGPWMILVTSFSGEDAEDKAIELVYELRKQYKLKAYTHKKTFDHTTDAPKRIDRYGDYRPMRFRHSGNVKHVAVMVGNFSSADDRVARKTLEKIKYDIFPECMSDIMDSASDTSMVKIREFYNRLRKKDRKRGPLGQEFAIPNHRLPKEYFAPGGVDKFVAKMNSGLKYSLLDCPGTYTVRVARFTGTSYVGQDHIEKAKKARKASSRLVEAASNTHRLTLALRQKGIEAYEFHDRTESIVTIGSFHLKGRLWPNGVLEIDPKIQQIITKFQPEQEELRNAHQIALASVASPAFRHMTLGVKPKTLADFGFTNWQGDLKGVEYIPFDVQAKIINVPRRSIAADYRNDSRK